MLFALEGPESNLVNGVDGDMAEDCNNVVIEIWRDFFMNHCRCLNSWQMCEWVRELALPTKCEGYGYPHVLAVLGDDLVNLVYDHEAKQRILCYVNSVDQYGRKLMRKRGRDDDAMERDSKKRKPTGKEEEGGESEIVALPIDVFGGLGMLQPPPPPPQENSIPVESERIRITPSNLELLLC
jgi:hypothetical protein